MSRHDLDLTSLVAGLVLVVIGALIGVEQLAGVELDLRLVWPALLIGLGLAGLSGSMFRDRGAR